MRFRMQTVIYAARIESDLPIPLERITRDARASELARVDPIALPGK
jgi:hypothetical protein